MRKRSKKKNLRKQLVKALVPHKHNDHLPMLLERRALMVVSTFLLIFTFGLSLSATLFIDRESFLGAVLPAVLVDLANADRSEAGIGTLTIDPRLQEAAQMKADHMAENAYFAHISPDGTEPWDWIERAEYPFFSAGENLAVHFKDSAEVERAWMDSPSHRANILNQGFTHIGIATARGRFEGHDTVFVVQMFGSPRVEPIGQEGDTISNEIIAYEDAGSDVRGSFVTFEKAGVTALSDTGETGVVAGSSPESRQYSTWWQRVVSRPYTFMQWGYLAIGAILLLVLLIAFISPARKKHKFALYRASVFVGAVAFIALALLPVLFPPVVVAF